MLLDCTHVRLRCILENFDGSVLPEDAMQEVRDSITGAASAASSHHSNARVAEECQSILSNMIAPREQYSGYCCLKAAA